MPFNIFSYIAIIVPANIAIIERGRITNTKVLFIKFSEFSKTENNIRANMYKEAFVAVAASKQKLQMEHKHMLLVTRCVKGKQQL